MLLQILSGKGAVQIVPFWKLGRKCHFLLRFCTRKRSETYSQPVLHSFLAMYQKINHIPDFPSFEQICVILDQEMHKNASWTKKEKQSILLLFQFTTWSPHYLSPLWEIPIPGVGWGPQIQSQSSPWQPGLFVLKFSNAKSKSNSYYRLYRIAAMKSLFRALTVLVQLVSVTLILSIVKILSLCSPQYRALD